MISSELNKNLRAKFNPEGSDLRRHQMVMLEILKYLDIKCKENNIMYWLSCGTALGAARHGGFIPWDDDLDVEMLRQDYLKLEKILEKDNKYDFQSYKTDFYYCCPYSKLRDKNSVIEEHEQDKNYRYKGIYIDIFPLEFVPSKIVGTATAMFRRFVLLYGAKSSTSYSKLIYRILKGFLFFSFECSRFVLKPFNTKHLRYTYGGGFLNEKRDMDSIFPLSEIEFEGCMFPAPNDMDKYLTLLYGDYNKLPTVEQIEHHVSKVRFL